MPTSVTSQWINSIGLLAAALTAGVLAVVGPNPLVGAIACMLAYAVPIALLELTVLRTHRRASTGLDWSRAGSQGTNWPRVWTKLLGLVVTLAAVAAIHWVVRLYTIEDMSIAALVVALLAVPILIVAIPYIAFVDARMAEPHDGYWLVGQMTRGRFDSIDWPVLREHLLSWGIKGFFLPIMFVYLTKNVRGLHANLDLLDGSHVDIVTWITSFVVLLELTIVCVGYFCTFRLLDAHIRSPNPLLAAWLVTLVVYEPFNRVITGEILDYTDGVYWYDWFADTPALSLPWAGLLLVSFAIWLWATMIFGLRWSNLTNRGIITNGPYRFTKHPDYVSKSIFFWLVNMPFLSMAGPVEGLKGALIMAMVNAIYLGRAKVEEKHLSADPDYVAYALAMEERSIFRWVGRWLPFMRFRAPAGMAATRPPEPTPASSAIQAAE